MGEYVRYRCEIGFLVDAEVVKWDDKDGPNDILGVVIAPAPPEAQPDGYDRHARIWAGEAFPWGDEFVSLPRPDGDHVVEVHEDDVWFGGAFALEREDVIAYEQAEHGVSYTVVERLIREMEVAAEAERLVCLMSEVTVRADP